ncbi:NAD(P)H-binding protein [Brachybacterium sp. p3-SID957]|uniref:NAD(P)H-binding protein n=1 Tax=Brachybacterium sp. p3-SID957 TaxID=2916049 RepID=UPI00223A8CC6|nr:NAD(P)H-binding protein [Brachybacterium sp. p3-SID957]MCT1776727.1 NAD(P)H-binding protein [Brachybacterium sp. p3-SID957]
MRVLIIGAGGYVGSRLIPALLEDRHQVAARARDLHKLDAFWWGDAVRGVELDATEDDSVRAAIAADPSL